MLCYRCENELEDGAKTCPHCERSQYRTCYCGQEIFKGLTACPHCNAAWEVRRHTWRERRRSRRRLTLSTMALTLAAALLAGVVVGAVIEGVSKKLFVPPPASPSAPSSSPAQPNPSPDPLDKASSQVAQVGRVLVRSLGELFGFLGSLLRLLSRHPIVSACVLASLTLGFAVTLQKHGYLRLRLPFVRRRRHRSRRRRAHSM